MKLEILLLDPIKVVKFLNVDASDPVFVCQSWKKIDFYNVYALFHYNITARYVSKGKKEIEDSNKTHHDSEPADPNASLKASTEGVFDNEFFNNDPFDDEIFKDPFDDPFFSKEYADSVWEEEEDTEDTSQIKNELSSSSSKSTEQAGIRINSYTKNINGDGPADPSKSFQTTEQTPKDKQTNPNLNQNENHLFNSNVSESFSTTPKIYTINTHFTKQPEKVAVDEYISETTDGSKIQPRENSHSTENIVNNEPLFLHREESIEIKSTTFEASGSEGEDEIFSGDPILNQFTPGVVSEKMDITFPTEPSTFVQDGVQSSMKPDTIKSAESVPMIEDNNEEGTKITTNNYVSNSIKVGFTSEKIDETTESVIDNVTNHLKISEEYNMVGKPQSTVTLPLIATHETITSQNRKTSISGIHINYLQHIMVMIIIHYRMFCWYYLHFILSVHDMILTKCLHNSTYQFTDVYEKHSMQDRTALHLAARYNRPHCIDILVKSGADMEAIDEDAATPISIAASMKDCASIEKLDTLGARTGHLDSRQKKNIRECYKCKSRINLLNINV